MSLVPFRYFWSISTTSLLCQCQHPTYNMLGLLQQPWASLRTAVLYCLENGERAKLSSCSACCSGRLTPISFPSVFLDSVRNCFMPSNFDKDNEKVVLSHLIIKLGKSEIPFKIYLSRWYFRHCINDLWKNGQWESTDSYLWVSFCQPDTKLDLPGKKEPQLQNLLRQTDMWAVFLIVDRYRRSQPAGVV